MTNSGRSQKWASKTGRLACCSDVSLLAHKHPQRMEEWQDKFGRTRSKPSNTHMQHQRNVPYSLSQRVRTGHRAKVKHLQPVTPLPPFVTTTTATNKCVTSNEPFLLRNLNTHSFPTSQKQWFVQRSFRKNIRCFKIQPISSIHYILSHYTLPYSASA